MESIGKPELRWVKGYNGKRARYIDKNTIAYVCGNNVNFMKEDGNSVVFTSPGEGITGLDVHPLNKMFAFAELCLNPKVFVFNYPDMKLVSELKDGAELEYTQIAFSTSDFLVTVSGVPDFKLTLWNYIKGEALLTVPLAEELVKSVLVNPANWRQISLFKESSITLCTIEQSDLKFNAMSRNVKMFVGEKSKEHIDDSASNRHDTLAMHRLELDLTPSAIAGLMEPEAEQFEDYYDSRMKCSPISQAWTPAGDLLIGCEHGQLLRYDAESGLLKLIFAPTTHNVTQLARDATLLRGTSLLSKEMSIMEEEAEAMPPNSTSPLGQGAINCMALHKHGLYIGGNDGQLRCVDITNDSIKLLDSYDIGVSITSLDFSTNWSHLNIGSDKGCMYTYDINAPGAAHLVMNEHSGNFVGVQSLAPGLELAVTVRENGEVQIWSLSDGKLVGSMSLGIEATALAASPVAPIIIAGTVSGFLLVIDLSDPEQGRIIHQTRAYNSWVTRLAYTYDGSLVLMGSADGDVIIMSGYASQEFKMLCYTKVEGAVETITTHQVEETKVIHVVVSSNNTGDVTHGANKCTTFQLTPEVISSVESYYSSLKADIEDEAINKIVFNYASPSYGACLTDTNTLYSLAQDSKKLQKILVPKEKPKKANSKDSFLLPEMEAEAHQLPGGKLLVSPHGKWLASIANDGKLQVRTLAVGGQFVESHPHDYRHGGVKTLCWSAGSQHILTTGRDDGILTCYSWNFTSNGESKGQNALAVAKHYQSSLGQIILQERDAVKAMSEWGPEPSKSSLELKHESPSPEPDEQSKMSSIEKAINNDEIYSTPTPLPKADTTWLEARELLAHTEEDKQYAETKKDLRYEIRVVRRKLLDLMEKNKSVPEIERLQHHDFDLDIDEQQRLQTVGDAEVNRIRDAMEFENLAKQYLTYLIKQECWDSMEVKGRSIEGFDIPLEVQNYPTQKRTQATLDELSRAMATRRIEMAEAKARADMVEIPIPKPSQAILAADDDGDEEDGEVEAPSVTGSMGSVFGGKSDLFYNQFELYSREQKVTQIILLNDAIYRIKATFNKEFDEVLKKKEMELSKIKDKNKRIAKIYADLNMMESVKVYPTSTKEKPELLLTVDDSEVTVEKYLTPEQKKAKEEFEKAEEERRRREQGDNARERALDQMMGGVLEIKKEDELKKDVPIPNFMISKEQDDWGEEENKQHKEYERKVKELQEEREKYRKQLEAELKKLQQFLSDAEQGFNEVLKSLFTKKLKVEMVICQEELKILRLQWGLMFEESLETTERQLVASIEHKKQLKQLAAEAYIVARKNVDNFKEGYDILVAEDKVMDKGFKREFGDLPALQNELLYKLFRKRPRATKLLHTRGETPILDANSGNPFAERPSTARQSMMQKHVLESALTDLDKPINIPEGVDHAAWQRLCNYRRSKIDSEMLVRQKALIMAEMMSFQQKRQDEDYKIAEEIEDLGQELIKLRELKQRQHLNLQVQLLMKQGQVELDAGSYIHNYKDSVLIHRGVVEDLNGKIKTLGESKIASMMESKDFRKGIVQLEWEHKKNLMKIEDLKSKMRVINMMKVTREIQSYLSEEDHDAKISQEVSILEQTIAMQKRHHEANVEAKKKVLLDLKHTSKDKSLENKILLNEIEELNVSVNERQHIHEASTDKNMEVAREKRYQEIVQRRKLVDLAKAQANEVAVLRAEVERLRMRTFPALVQVER